jgi:type II secretory pathway component GspD/PulD (secretin)
MKAIQFLILPAWIFAISLSPAQSPAEPPALEPLVEPVPPATPATPGSTGLSPQAPPPAAPAVPAIPATPTPPATTPPPATEPVPPVDPLDPLTQQKSAMEASEEGYLIKDAPINDIFQFLAKAAGRQYFHNAKIAGPEFRVTGHLNDGNPLTQMEELAFMYGLALHTKGNTIYALTQAQLAQLPSMEFHYQLQYLRPTDIKQIQELIKPMLNPASGIVNFEPKTNTIVIIDSAARIEQARLLLRGIDKAKGQIIVETKILRINSTAGERSGIDWSSSLGTTGTTLSVARDLNSVFGLPPSLASSIKGGEGTNLVLSPLQISGVLRALADGGLASQISNPTLITEDNELATISIIDRVPIIVTTTTASSSGTSANPTVTEEVRYKIDTSDKSIDTDPDKHREIGISLVVTPTLLPDGTVRMKLRPRSAQIVDEITSTTTGNKYPRVTESMIETLARVPNGYSLVVGGFYGETKTNGKNKVPLLGDIPVINFFFKSKEASKERTSLVFIVTPKSYDPTNRSANASASNFVRSGTTLDADHAWVDDQNPGPANEPNLCRTLRGMKQQRAPYYPLPGEEPAAAPQYQPTAKEALPAVKQTQPGPQPKAKSRLTPARRN